MFLLILTVQALSAEAATVLCGLMSHNLGLIQEPGYLGGKCGLDIDNPTRVVLVEEWGSLAAVQAWLASSLRRQWRQQALPLTSGPEAWQLTIFRVA